MFVVITGLDGSGTSSIAEGLYKLDKERTIYVNNNSTNVDETVKQLYKTIDDYKKIR